MILCYIRVYIYIHSFIVVVVFRKFPNMKQSRTSKSLKCPRVIEGFSTAGIYAQEPAADKRNKLNENNNKTKTRIKYKWNKKLRSKYKRETRSTTHTRLRGITERLFPVCRESLTCVRWFFAQKVPTHTYTRLHGLFSLRLSQIICTTTRPPFIFFIW